jgi:hypothetical protein
VVHWRGPEPARAAPLAAIAITMASINRFTATLPFQFGSKCTFCVGISIAELDAGIAMLTLSRARLASRKEQHALRTHPTARAAAQAKDRGGLKSGGGIDEITLPGIGKPWLLGVSGNSTPAATISIAAVQAAQHPLLQAPLPPWPQRSQQWPRVAAPTRAADTAFTVL